MLVNSPDALLPALTSSNRSHYLIRNSTSIQSCIQWFNTPHWPWHMPIPALSSEVGLRIKLFFTSIFVFPFISNGIFCFMQFSLFAFTNCCHCNDKQTNAFQFDGFSLECNLTNVPWQLIFIMNNTILQ